MNITVLFFGQLTDITQTSQMVIPEVQDSDSLKSVLYSKFPGLSNAKYMIAVDHQIIYMNTKLKPDSTVALLPPFSGG